MIRIFSVFVFGIMINLMITSFIAVCYTDYANNSGNLTHINLQKGESIVNIHGY